MYSPARTTRRCRSACSAHLDPRDHARREEMIVSAPDTMWSAQDREGGRCSGSPLANAGPDSLVSTRIRRYCWVNAPVLLSYAYSVPVGPYSYVVESFFFQLRSAIPSSITLVKNLFVSLPTPTDALSRVLG
jgi:hypothetical protein